MGALYPSWKTGSSALADDRRDNHAGVCFVEIKLPLFALDGLMGVLSCVSLYLYQVYNFGSVCHCLDIRRRNTSHCVY